MSKVVFYGTSRTALIADDNENLCVFSLSIDPGNGKRIITLDITGDALSKIIEIAMRLRKCQNTSAYGVLDFEDPPKEKGANLKSTNITIHSFKNRTL